MALLVVELADSKWTGQACSGTEPSLGRGGHALLEPPVCRQVPRNSAALHVLSAAEPAVASLTAGRGSLPDSCSGCESDVQAQRAFTEKEMHSG